MPKAGHAMKWLLVFVAPALTYVALAGWMRDVGFRPGIVPDSVYYIESARNFAHGFGISIVETGALRPVNHWAPLSPVALGSGIMLGRTAEASAIATNAFFLALTLLLMGVVTLRLSQSVAAAAAVQVVGALSWEILGLHFFVLSEPLFLALMMGGAWALVEYQLRQRFAWLALASVLLSLAVMCRYAGLGIVAGALIYLVWRSRHKVRDAVALGAATIGPFALWSVFHHDAQQAVAGRAIRFLAPAMSNVESGLRTLGDFINPQATTDTAEYYCAAITVGILAAAIYWRRTRLLGVIGAAYLAFVLASLTTVDSGIRLDSRILAPVLPLLLIVAVTAVALALRSIQDRRDQAFAVCVALVILFDYAGLRAQRSMTELLDHIENGFGVESSGWLNSPILQRIRDLPTDVVPISGRATVLQYLTGRAGLSKPVDPSGADDPQVQRIAQRLRTNRCALVELDRLRDSEDAEDVECFQNWFDVEFIARERDGALYWIRNKGASGRLESTLEHGRLSITPPDAISSPAP